MKDPQSGWGESSGLQFLSVQLCGLTVVYLQKFIFVCFFLEAHVSVLAFASDPWLKL